MRARSTGAGNQSQQASFSGREHVENCAVEPSEYLKHQLTPSPGLVALAKAPQRTCSKRGLLFCVNRAEQSNQDAFLGRSGMTSRRKGMDRRRWKTRELAKFEATKHMSAEDDVDARQR